ncbi:protein-tyrosine phosphatase family protein [Kitasatospora camelliae]|uniref:Protein phosphatase n=1 Tax=Kitasatospora camelliae TaxID=3156397 RepID=A0AAU8K355_9ACTN
MRTRQKDRGTPGPEEPWNEITTGLWMGGHHWTDRTGELQPAVVHRQFDLVVSLYSRPGHGPDPDVPHLVGEMPDGPLTAEQLGTVQELAQATTAARQAGRTVLVRCHSGYNRSGLVVAQTLLHLGHDLESAAALIRRRRSPWALNNPLFTDYLTIGLDTARLLTGLDEPV